ncbi:MAG: hypothetical protein CMH57_10395 [Myxococcales bacterium]|nr:hypothetical protein [Myxococcales bacterium]
MNIRCISCGHEFQRDHANPVAVDITCARCGYQFRVWPSPDELDTVRDAWEQPEGATPRANEAPPAGVHTLQGTPPNLFTERGHIIDAPPAQEAPDDFLGDIERAHLLNAFMDEEPPRPGDWSNSVGAEPEVDDLFQEAGGADPFDSADFRTSSQGIGPIKRRRFDVEEDDNPFTLGSSVEGNLGLPERAPRQPPEELLADRFSVSQPLFEPTSPPQERPPRPVDDPPRAEEPPPVEEPQHTLAEVAQEVAAPSGAGGASEDFWTRQEQLKAERSREVEPVQAGAPRARAFVGVVLFLICCGGLGAGYLILDEPSVGDAVGEVSEEVSDSIGEVVDEARDEVRDVVAPNTNQPRDVRDEVMRKLRQRRRETDEAIDEAVAPKTEAQPEGGAPAPIMKNYVERIETRPDGSEVRVWVRREEAPKAPEGPLQKQRRKRQEKRARAARSTRSVPAPPLVLFTADGREVNLRRLRGQVVVLNMYATWCPPCKAEIPDFSRFHRDAPAGVKVYGVVYQSGDARKATGDSRKLGVEYPVLLGNNGTARKWGVRAFPTTIVVDRHGNISHRITGQVSYAQLERMVAEASR